MTWINPANPFVPVVPHPRTTPVPTPYPVPIRTELVDCAACKGTGLNQLYTDGSGLCKGCNGAGKQRV